MLADSRRVKANTNEIDNLFALPCHRSESLAELAK